MRCAYLRVQMVALPLADPGRSPCKQRRLLSDALAMMLKGTNLSGGLTASGVNMVTLFDSKAQSRDDRDEGY